MMKRFATVVIAAAMMIGGVGVANAQMHGSHGGSSGGGGSWHGGGSSGGAWHGGGSWHGGGWYGGHSHVVVGVGFGWPYWGWGWPGYYSGYYYPYAYSAYYPYSYGYPYGYDPGYSGYSGSYIEQGTPAPAAPSAPARGEYSPQSQYSYYCPDPAGYYPQVPTCAKGWLRVVPQSAPGPTGPTTY
jgi:hypothetical protein